MAKLKMKKLPSKPKASASVAVKERFLQKVSEIQKENARRVAENKKSDALSKKIAGIGSSTRAISTPTMKRKKSTTTKRKTKSKSKSRKR